MRKAAIAVSLAAFAGSIVAIHTREASAQVVNQVSPTGKGITGCALLGAEAVALVEAAAGVHTRWTYAVFPLLGAAGGAAGGYFLEQAASGNTGLTAVSVVTLVVGLGLVIPTTIAYVSATSYRPDTDAQATDDAAPSTTPLEESATPGTANPAATPAPAGSVAPGTGQTGVQNGPAPQNAGPAGGSTSITPHRTPTGGLVAARTDIVPGLLNLGAQGVSLGVPAVSVGNAYTVAEMRQYGQTAVAELRVPVLSGTF